MALLGVHSRWWRCCKKTWTHPITPAQQSVRAPTAEPTLLAPHVIEPITRVLKEMERSGHVILSHKRITLLKKLPDRY